MKILYTTHQFYPDYGAGTELLTYMTASQMAQKGHSVGIVTGFPHLNETPPDGFFDEYTFDGLPVYRYRHSSFHPVGNQCIMEAEHHNRMVQTWFKQLLVRFQPDLVHVFHLQRLSAGILETCYELGVPYVITVTDFWLICPTTQLLLPDRSLCAGPQKMMVNCIKHLAAKTSNPLIGLFVEKLPDSLLHCLLRLLDRKAGLRVGPLANLHAITNRAGYILNRIDRADRLFVTNAFMQKMLETHSVRRDKIEKMAFGIQPLDSVKKHPKSEQDVLRVGFIGTLNYHKGAHVAIKAVAALSRYKRVQLKIYGNRNQFPEYVKFLDALAANDPRIVFTGTFPPDQLGRVFSVIDLLVVPSLWYENTPLILHQAQAAKVPIIATDLGGMNELVAHGVNGYLIKPDQDKELCALIDSLIDDPSIIDVLRQNIKAPVLIDQYADELDVRYRQIRADRQEN